MTRDEAIDMAYAALRGPDPDTGLVPCGMRGDWMGNHERDQSN